MVSFSLLTIFQMLMISSFNKGGGLILHYLLLVEKITAFGLSFFSSEGGLCTSEWTDFVGDWFGVEYF